MARDTTLKEQNMAIALIDASTRLMRANADLFDLAYAYVQEGASFTEAALADNPKTQHVLPADLVAVITSSDALHTWLQSTNNEDNFYKVIANYRGGGT